MIIAANAVRKSTGVKRKMTELERRALLGDRQAQENCTRQGIDIPCRICGGKLKDKEFSERSYGYDICHACKFGAVIVISGATYEEALAKWNAGVAPPIYPRSDTDDL